MSLPQPTLYDAVWLLGQVYLYMPGFVTEIQDMEREILASLARMQESITEIAKTQARIEERLSQIERSDKREG